MADRRAAMILKGKEIAKAYMGANLIGREDLFFSREAEHMNKRAGLIRLLASHGLRQIEIARVIDGTPEMVRYWLVPSDRARRLRSMSSRNAALRA